MRHRVVAKVAERNFLTVLNANPEPNLFFCPDLLLCEEQSVARKQKLMLVGTSVYEPSESEALQRLLQAKLFTSDSASKMAVWKENGGLACLICRLLIVVL